MAVAPADGIRGVNKGHSLSVGGCCGNQDIRIDPRALNSLGFRYAKF